MSNYKAKKRLDYKAPDFTATNIELEFILADERTEVIAVTRYQRLTDDRKAPLVLDGEDLELVEISLNGAPCDCTCDKKSLTIENVPDDFELFTKVIISPASNTQLMGLYKTDGVFSTQCEPEGFRRITYFIDRPDVLAKYKVKIVAPEYGCGILLSNGNLIERGVKDNRQYCVYEDPFPKPSYLFALVAGSFDVIEDSFTTKSGRKVSLFVYVDRGTYERGLYAMECIKQAMKWDEERFNLEYDLDIFNVVAVDFFNQGAMENKSLNIFNSAFVLVSDKTGTDTNYFNIQSVIGHEYFHNWTGDRVTLRDWFQLSLKESLTVFRDQEFSSDVGSRALTRLGAIDVIRGPQFAEDASPMAHPVRPESVMEMNNFYTVTIYDKGSEVIRMIHTILGEDLFQKGIAKYISTYDGMAVTIEDFLGAMESASGYDLTQFRRWYTQAGTPTITSKWSYDETKRTLSLTLSQETLPTKDQEVKEPFFIPIRTSFLNVEGDYVHPKELSEDGVLILKEKEQTFVFSDIDANTLPVLLEDFSAPVKHVSMYTQNDYKHMLSYSKDAFIKKDSAESLFKQYLQDNIAVVNNGGELPEPTDIIEAFNLVIEDKNIEELLICELLKIPSIQNMMEMFQQIDIDALHTLHTHLEKSIALALKDSFEKLYVDSKVGGAYKYNIKDASKRALHNLALNMLVTANIALNDFDKANELCQTQYTKSNNLTEQLAAMKLSVHNELPCSTYILNDFENKFDGDPLVFDNYFRAQATSYSEDTVFKVRKLMSHKCFDISNPNRVRALVGTMALQNPIALHKIDGTGYLLLSDVVLKLDSINPHVAARIISPLLSYKRFDEKRQSLILEVLQKIKNTPNLSNSVYEKVNAALGD